MEYNWKKNIQLGQVFKYETCCFLPGWSYRLHHDYSNNYGNGSQCRVCKSDRFYCQICVHLDLPLVTGHIQTSVSHLCAHRHFFFVCITDCILYPESQFASALFMCPYSVFVNMSRNKLSVCMCVWACVWALFCNDLFLSLDLGWSGSLGVY